jgi:hypothetical protein
LDSPESFGDPKGLAEGVAVPGSAGTRAESNRVHTESGGHVAVSDLIDVDVADEHRD